MATIYGYCRASTDDQSITISSQRNKLIEAGVPAANIYSDHGVSGKTAWEDRPQLSRIVNLMMPGDTIAFVKWDRLARSMLEALTFMQDLHIKKCYLRCLAQNVDTGTIEGRFFAQIFLSMAEMERGMAVQRTRDALAEIKRTGIGRKGQPVRLGSEPKVTPEDLTKLFYLRKAELKTPGAIAAIIGISRMQVYRILSLTPSELVRIYGIDPTRDLQGRPMAEIQAEVLARRAEQKRLRAVRDAARLAEQERAFAEAKQHAA